MNTFWVRHMGERRTLVLSQDSQQQEPKQPCGCAEVRHTRDHNVVFVIRNIADINAANRKAWSAWIAQGVTTEEKQ